MTFNKNFKITIIILSFMFILLSACSNGECPPDNYADIIKAAAYVDPSDIDIDIEVKVRVPEPTTEIITGTVNINFTQTEPEGDEIFYVVTPSGKRYHYQSCHTARNIHRYLTKEEAEHSGYTPCGICKPE
ncbi:MAG: hypothetical protein FWH10_07530 [Oscillospiraceae bacterium]|nr:hypothetical protein [Oscillospiraceae bacterium]